MRVAMIIMTTGVIKKRMMTVMTIGIMTVKVIAVPSAVNDKT
jgi:hypothetical protein